MGRILLTIAGLDALYLVALERVSPGDAAAGALWSALFLWWFHAQVSAPRRGSQPGIRLEHSPRVFVAALARGFRGAVAVLRGALSRNPARDAGFVEVPIGRRTDAGTAASALFDSLSPGSVVVDIDTARGIMTIHVMDATDKEALRAERQDFYHRHQRRAIP
jgi:multisubunit Na+/H+ antiporter MnhE subunit